MQCGLFWLFNLCAASAATFAWGSEERQWLALAIAVVLVAYLGLFAAARRAEGQAVPRTRVTSTCAAALATANVALKPDPSVERVLLHGDSPTPPTVLHPVLVAVLVARQRVFSRIGEDSAAR